MQGALERALVRKNDCSMQALVAPAILSVQPIAPWNKGVRTSSEDDTERVSKCSRFEVARDVRDESSGFWNN